MTVHLNETDIPPIIGDVGRQASDIEARHGNSYPQVFRPTSVVTLTFRLEEYNDTTGLDANLRTTGSESTASSAQAPATRATVIDAIADNAAQLLALRLRQSTTPPSQFQRELADLRQQSRGLVAQLANAPDVAAPPFVTGAPPDDRTITLPVLPTSVSIERNGLKTADTCTFVCNASDIPFDPRVMRAAAVEVTIGIIDPIAYESGARGARRADGSPVSMIQQALGIPTLSPSNRIQPGPRAPQSTRFVGVVDTFQIEYDADGDTITMQCRDFTALFLDTPLATGSGIDLTLPIDQGIQAFIDSYPTIAHIQVTLAAGTTPVTPTNAVSRIRRARRGRTGRTIRNGDSKMSVWDQIVETCQSCGFTAIIHDYKMILTGPSLYDVEPVTPRTMVYGINLSHLEFTRKLAGTKVPTVQVQAFDPELGRMRWARYPTRSGTLSSGVFGVTNPPPMPTRANETSVSGSTPEERIHTFNIHLCVTDPGLLQDIARQAFENIGRQEIEGNFETSDVSSFEAPGSIDGTDLMDMDTADPIELLITGERGAPRAAGALTAAQLAELSIEGRTLYLVGLGYDETVARRYSEILQATAFQTVFRIQNVRVEFDVDEGLKISADFQNYIEVRESSLNSTDSDARASQESVDGPVNNTLGARNDRAAEALRNTVRQRRALNRRRSVGGLDPGQFAGRQAELDQRAQRELAESETGIGEGEPGEGDGS